MLFADPCWWFIFTRVLQTDRQAYGFEIKKDFFKISNEKMLKNIQKNYSKYEKSKKIFCLFENMSYICFARLIIKCLTTWQISTNTKYDFTYSKTTSK